MVDVTNGRIEEGQRGTAKLSLSQQTTDSSIVVVREDDNDGHRSNRAAVRCL